MYLTDQLCESYIEEFWKPNTINKEIKSMFIIIQTN